MIIGNASIFKTFFFFLFYFGCIKFLSFSVFLDLSPRRGTLNPAMVRGCVAIFVASFFFFFF